MTRRIDNPDTEADLKLRACLEADPRACFVMVAGAGSGKTTSLVKALGYVRRRHGAALRQRGQRVACITYTEIATGEVLRDVGDDHLYHVSTIHGFLWEIIQPFQRDIQSWVRRRLQEKHVDLEDERAAFGSRVHQKTRDKNQRNIERVSEQIRGISNVARFSYGTGSDYLAGVLGHDDIVRMVPDLIVDRPLLRRILAQKYPFIFVDESQDTFPGVAESLKSVAVGSAGSCCLGFFGDPMQKIYGHGVGDIELGEGHERITKVENFRCPPKVLSVINRIRSAGDALEQKCGRATSGECSVEGRAKLFVLPADENRTVNLSRVREWMARDGADDLWNSDAGDADLRILVRECSFGEDVGFLRPLSGLVTP